MMELIECIKKLEKSKIKAGDGEKAGKYPLYTCSPKVNKFCDYYLYNTEAIILGTGGNPVINYHKGEFSYSTDCLAIQSKGEFENKYLYYYLMSKISDISKMFRGAGIKHLNKRELFQMNINLIDKKEQIIIVKNLDRINEIIELKKKQLEELNTIIKSQFVEMFDLEKYESEELGKICDVRDGTHDSPKYIDKSDYKLITSKNINKEGIDFSDVKYISKKDYDKINIRSNVSYGDILMPMIGTIGNPTIVTIQKEKIDFAIKNLALIKFLNKTLVINKYIKNLINSEWFENKILKNRRGGTQKFISLKDIRKMKIPVPPITLQNQFSEIVKQIDKQKFESMIQLKMMEKIYNIINDRRRYV
jgi:type I restriction-modification enzyme, S subunit